MKIEPHDGLEVGAAMDDEPNGAAEGAYATQHRCHCSCGEAGCRERVWRVGLPARCAVCASKYAS